MQASSAQKEKEEGVDVPSLPKLLNALALGARAVNALPLSSSTSASDSENEDGQEEEDDDDEFAFQYAFPEFATLCDESRLALSDLLSLVLSSTASSRDDHNNESRKRTGGESTKYEYDDPVLWEKCADLCDALLEQVEIYLQSVKEGNVGKTMTTTTTTKATDMISNAADRAREIAQTKHGRMMSGLVDMEKPQITHSFAGLVQNSRYEPFIPPIHPLKPHGITPIEEATKPQPGHGLDTRYEKLLSRMKIPDDAVAPDVHYPHPYREEIESLTYRSWQLEVPTEEELGEHGLGCTLKRKRGEDTSNNADDDDEEENDDDEEEEEGVWIDTEDDLRKLVERVESENVREIAVDLEAHSYRTFAGYVCLMQLSIRRPPSTTGGEGKPNPKSARGREPPTVETSYDFLIDTLTLRKQMNHYLAPMFANPDIVKVMHGADYDIPWLQRDFGLYVVNLFDTGRAARMLSFQSAGLAYLLSRYAGVEADKKHQLSDWRQRPLPAEMRAYAVSDTKYLLDIYDRLRLELESHSNPQVNIRAVLDVSKKVCLIRYDKDPFRPSGYRSLMHTRRGMKKGNMFTAKQERVLKALYDWRDAVAREHDESIQYVCENTALIRISLACPQSVTALQSLFNPLPPLIMQDAQRVLDVIKRASQEESDAKQTASNTKPVTSSPEKISQLRASASPFAFFKPAKSSAGVTAPSPSPVPGPTSSTSAGERESGILSPVLGTEALYKQAGWMTPQLPPSAGYAQEEGGATMASGESDVPSGGRGTTTDESEYTSDDKKDDLKKKRRHLLGVNDANRGYVATHYTPHSLEMGSVENEDDAVPDSRKESNRRGRTVDGLGAARAALGRNDKSNDPAPHGSKTTRTVEDECEVAQTSATRIRGAMIDGKDSLLNLVKADPSIKFEDDARDKFLDDDNCDDNNGEDDEADDDDDNDENSIPKSMREIYRISNRNRRRNKKVSSSLSPQRDAGRDTSDVERMDVDTLSGAEAVLASRGINGMGYFEGAATPTPLGSAVGARSKRQRTRQQEADVDGSDGESPAPASPGRDEDIALLEEVGWIKDRKEAEEMMVERSDDGATSEMKDGSVGAADGNYPGENDGNNPRSGSAASKPTRRNGKGSTRVESDGAIAAGVSLSRHSGQQATAAANRNSNHEYSARNMTESYDYSSIGPIGAYNPKAPPSSNPFFAGAAVSGGILAQSIAGSGQTFERKRGGGPSSGRGKPGRGNAGERPGKRDGGRSFVYRSGSQR